jgi:hypothetical protein
VPARYVETVYVDPSRLRPYPGNPNHADVEELRGSVRRNGQYRPVIARAHPSGDYEILAGHGTTEATGAEAGKVRVEVHDVDDATARRIVAIDNTRPKGSTFDEEALLALLAQAEAEDGLDGTGYVEGDLDDLRALLEETDRQHEAPTPTPGPDDNVRHTNGLNDLKGAYGAATSRLVVLSYEGARYVWVIEKFAELADRLDVDSNADVILRLLADATGETPPADGEEATGDALDDATATASSLT